MNAAFVLSHRYDGPPPRKERLSPFCLEVSKLKQLAIIVLLSYTDVNFDARVVGYEFVFLHAFTRVIFIKREVVMKSLLHGYNRQLVRFVNLQYIPLSYLFPSTVLALIWAQDERDISGCVCWVFFLGVVGGIRCVEVRSRYT